MDFSPSPLQLAASAADECRTQFILQQQPSQSGIRRLDGAQPELQSMAEGKGAPDGNTFVDPNRASERADTLEQTTMSLLRSHY
jgi:hypothetical protein